MSMLITKNNNILIFNYTSYISDNGKIFVYFRLKEAKQKDRLKKFRKRLIPFSRKDQEISELVIIFNPKEIWPDSWSGQDILHSKDKKEFFSQELKFLQSLHNSQKPWKKIRVFLFLFSKCIVQASQKVYSWRSKAEIS